ncbi:MAG: hypothetical protein PUC05_01110 [Firmicutes bacterium]|nr:hypothetical protein [Bacillota bacterium]
MSQITTVKISSCFWCVFFSLFPVVGLAYLTVKASSSKDPNIKNLSKALLLLRAAVLVLGTVSALGAVWLLDALI